MTFYVENETDETFSNGENSFPIEETVEQVATAVLDMEGCPYEIQLNVLLTDNDGIHAYNKEYRKIDRETDVLSFPNLDFDEPGDFEISEDREADYFDPDTGIMYRDCTLKIKGKNYTFNSKGVCTTK